MWPYPNLYLFKYLNVSALGIDNNKYNLRVQRNWNKITNSCNTCRCLLQCLFSCTVLYKQIKHLNTRIAVLPVSCMTVRLGLCHIKWKRQIKGVGKESAYGNIWTSEGWGNWSLKEGSHLEHLGMTGYYKEFQVEHRNLLVLHRFVVPHIYYNYFFIFLI